jgi:3-deoxy-manno-octulosonate cytidylyltransferase (CMP-KDO synthetase)
VEGLEQMRFLENGMRIKVVPVDYQGRKTTSGVDSPEDIKRVEEILTTYGELQKK